MTGFPVKSSRTLEKLAAVPREWLEKLVARLEPIWLEHQLLTLPADEEPPTPDYRLCRYTALLVSRALTRATGETWRVAGGSPWPPYFATGGFQTPDGEWHGHYWATNGRVVVDLAARQFGEQAVVIVPATDPRYRRNYDDEELERHLAEVRQRVMHWERRMKFDLPAKTGQLDANAVQAFVDGLRTELGLKDLSIAYRASQKSLCLHMLSVPRERRDQGIGTAAMKRILAFADQHQLRLALSPDDRNAERGTTSKARLVRWYKRMGFVENKGRHKDYAISETMYREPATLKPAPRRVSADEGPTGP